jgi:hypothetical protein
MSGKCSQSQIDHVNSLLPLLCKTLFLCFSYMALECKFGNSLGEILMIL